MARLMYGHTGGDVLAQVDAQADYTPSVDTYNVFTSRTGSTQHTGLLSVGGSAITFVSPDAAGRIRFQGQDTYTGPYWLQSITYPTQDRWLVNPVDLASRTTGSVDGGVPAAHAASHKTGGTDPLAPADIGAASTSELAEKADQTALDTLAADVSSFTTEAEVQTIVSGALVVPTAKRMAADWTHPFYVGGTPAVTVTSLIGGGTSGKLSVPLSVNVPMEFRFNLMIESPASAGIKIRLNIPNVADAGNWLTAIGTATPANGVAVAVLFTHGNTVTNDLTADVAKGFLGRGPGDPVPIEIKGTCRSTTAGNLTILASQNAAATETTPTFIVRGGSTVLAAPVAMVDV